MSNFTCALSGQTPIPDPVALPTGEICSKALLLQKLTETSNINPFHAQTPLDESQLIGLTQSTSIVPPRSTTTTSTNSIPSILNTLSSEYDALVLELFDTRKALEETRKELSHALYQNDAAVRVIARVVMERDMARKDLAAVTVPAATATEGSGNKRKRIDKGEANVVPADEGTVPPAAAAESTGGSGIPQPIKEELKTKWSSLIQTRKAKTKATESYATPDQISNYSVSKKSYHKTSAKGIVSMVGGMDDDAAASASDSGSHCIITCSKDKYLTVYDLNEHKVIKSLNAKVMAGNLNLLHCMGDTAAMVGSDGGIRVYVKVGGEDQKLIVPDGVELDDVVGIKVHPTGKHVFVAEKSGCIHLFAIDADKGSMTEAAVWNSIEGIDSDCTCSCIGLHPDGFILAIGRTDGNIGLWDLSTEKLATTLKGTSNSSIACIAFSEKGIHIASANEEGTVAVWDLRKQKCITTLDAQGDAADDDAKVQVQCIAFCPIGKYLAFGTVNGKVHVTVVKDWNTRMVLSDDKGKVTGLVWGKEAKSLIATSESSRMVKFWGAP